MFSALYPFAGNDPESFPLFFFLFSSYYFSLYCVIIITSFIILVNSLFVSSYIINILLLRICIFYYIFHNFRGRYYHILEINLFIFHFLCYASYKSILTLWQIRTAYRIIHISPLQPSFIILSTVSLTLFLASAGIRYSLL